MQKLRIFDDHKSKIIIFDFFFLSEIKNNNFFFSLGGCVIQGVIEDLVKSPADVIKIMQKGTSKRKVAATNMNQQSRFETFISLFTFNI